MFLVMSATAAQVHKILISRPSFTITPRLKVQVSVLAQYLLLMYMQVSIKSYAEVVLLSSKLASYKGADINMLLLRMLQRVSALGIPSSLDTDPAAFALLLSACSDSLTQARSSVKKTVRTMCTTFYER